MQRPQNIIMKGPPKDTDLKIEREDEIKTPLKVQFEVKIGDNISRNDDSNKQARISIPQESQRSSAIKKRKKKKKKKLTTSSLTKDMMEEQLKGYSEALPIPNPGQDDHNKLVNVELHIEDIQNDNYTDVNQLGAGSYDVHMDQQQYPQQSASDVFNLNKDHNIIRVPPLSKISINVVTYDRQATGRQHPPSGSKSTLQSKNKNIANADSYGNNTDSIYFGNESGRLNDFVIQRESMNFKRIPSGARRQEGGYVRNMEEKSVLDGMSQDLEVLQGSENNHRHKKSSDGQKIKGGSGGASQTINLTSIQASMINEGINEENARDDQKSMKTVLSESHALARKGRA